MGIFNTKIFDELEEGFKRFKNRVIRNTSEKQYEVLKCPNCGATLPQNEDEKIIKCEYCGTDVKNANYFPNWFED